jgi:hypothetical protein
MMNAYAGSVLFRVAIHLIQHHTISIQLLVLCFDLSYEVVDFMTILRLD